MTLLEFPSAKAYAATEGEGDDLNEPDDMELDWWDAGAAFGVPVPLDVITDVPSEDKESSSSHQLIAADDIDVQSVRVHSGSSCGSAGFIAETARTSCCNFFTLQTRGHQRLRDLPEGRNSIFGSR